MNEWWREHLPMVLDSALHVLGALFILLLAWFGDRYLKSPLKQFLGRSHLDPTAASFLTNSARAIFFLVVILAVLQQLGIQTVSFLTLLGAAGVAVALSLQSSLANLASGILILSFRMVRVGDTIEIGELRGKVAELLPLHVVLVTQDNQRVTVPNTLLTNGPMRNHTALPVRRLQWTLPLRLEDDLSTVKANLLGRLAEDQRILTDPAPEIYVQEWSLDKRVLFVGAWTSVENFIDLQHQKLETLGAAVDQVRQKAA
jgi:small conductance mechanosensitive channel